jgi:ABC-type uncharacterized transport system permease subunit
VVLHAVCVSRGLQPSGIDIGILSVASLIGFTLVLFVYVGSSGNPREPLRDGVAAWCARRRRIDHVEWTDHFERRLRRRIARTHPDLDLAYIALAMAVGQSIILAFQERSLRHKSDRIRAVAAAATDDETLFQLLWVGLITLTLDRSGLCFHRHVRAIGGVATILASASWVVFACCSPVVMHSAGGALLQRARHRRLHAAPRVLRQ